MVVPTSSPVPSETPPPSRCLNCGHALTGRYCSQCGQEATPPLPHVRELLPEILDEFVKLDAKGPRSLWMLIRHPGQMTVEYANGRRAAYVTPFKLYFVTSFFFYLVVELNGDANARSWGFSAPLDSSSPVVRATENAMAFYFQHAAVISILLLPLNALALAGLFYGRRQPILLHLVNTLHVWSGTVLWYIPAYLLAELTLRIQPFPAAKAALGPAYLLLSFAYQVIAYRRIYRGTWTESTLKSAAVGIWTTITSFLAMLVLLVAFAVLEVRGTAPPERGRTGHAQGQQDRGSGPRGADGTQHAGGLQQPGE
jgi:hypothetical protein